MILGLLQFVTPLVHAHSDNDIALESLHLPEIENLSEHYQHPIIDIANGIKYKKNVLVKIHHLIVYLIFQL